MPHETPDQEIAREAASNAKAAWFDATEAAISHAADANGWSMLRRSASQGGSDYYELSRESEDGETLEEFTLRISDHPSLYCRETYSVAMQSGGDDHHIETVLGRLAQPRIA